MTDTLCALLEDHIKAMSVDLPTSSLHSKDVDYLHHDHSHDHPHVHDSTPSARRWRPTDPSTAACATMRQMLSHLQPPHSNLSLTLPPSPPSPTTSFATPSDLGSGSDQSVARFITSNTKIISEVRLCLQALEISTKFLLSLVDDVLSFGRLESGVMELEVRPVKLKEALSGNLFVLLGESAKSSGIRFECRVEEGVPEVVEVDLLRLEQVVNNLVSNAFK
ncbi:hypothetical protein HK102_011328, partial [Quaeritorhiza haematococci]